jgi:polyketide biosynthesis enoyl-CoA hydratase PksI
MNHVVQLDEVEDGVVVIRMEERAHKNLFTEDLVTGLVEAFAAIRVSERYKVAVLTGYDSYFATGGTSEALFALNEAKGHFTDVNIYGLALDCAIPVISAMQGHAIGGGFVMGLYADIVVMSRESIYCTNFMKFGFTPGMGATCVVPEKLGGSLAHELLFTARNYQGEELRQRGIPFSVLPRREVLPRACTLARDMARMPRHSLVTLKAHMTAGLHQRLPAIIAQEVRMHDETFHQPEVKQAIATLFGQ